MNKRFRPRPRLPTTFHDRTYRRRVSHNHLIAFQVVCQETDLMIQADRLLDREAREEVLTCRGHIEGFIQRYPTFATALVPWDNQALAPEIVRAMIGAGNAAGVGPMAAVAGAVAQRVGWGLLKHSRQVVVENGGDIFLKTDGPVVAGLFAGSSPLSMNVGLRLADTRGGIGLCTSSGSVGHSLSTGSADAVCVVAPDCALADAAATSIGNRVHFPRDIQSAIAFGKTIDGVLGIVVVAAGEMGAWGQVELVPLKEKKVEF